MQPNIFEDVWNLTSLKGLFTYYAKMGGFADFDGADNDFDSADFDSANVDMTASQ